MSGQLQILCVDDEANVLRAIERVFLDDDYEVITASSGEAGLAMLAENPSVQLVISDYRMPGMNGVEFLRRVRDSRPDTIRIVLSGYADTPSVVAAINDGQIYKFLPKPWKDDELRETVNRALEFHILQSRNRHLTEELSKSNSYLQDVNEQLEKMMIERGSELLIQDRAIRQSQKILNLIPLGLLVIDSDGAVIRCNRAAETLLGIPLSEILNASQLSIVLPKDIVLLYQDVYLNWRDACSTLSLGGAVLYLNVMPMEDLEERMVLVLISCAGAAGKEPCHG